MASMERMSSFRHEGHIFFIYNHTMKTEEDDPKDAILYFYPSFVETDDQVALVGGIIGLVDFCLEFQEPKAVPSIVKLSFRNFALLQHEEFIIGLGGSPDIPDVFLAAHMQFVWSTFVLYQGSLSALRQRVSASNFIGELKNVLDQYLPLRQIQEDPLSQAFQALPYVQLNKSQGQIFLLASHIIQRSLTHKGVLAGAIFSKNKVLCTQLNNGLTRQMLLLMSHSQFPCVEVNSVLELPGGVRLLHVYLPKNEWVGLGHRRKKAYVLPKTDRHNKNFSKQSSRITQLSLGTPDYISAHNYFLEGVSDGSDMINSSKQQFQNGGDAGSDNRSSGRRETNTSMVSPTGGRASGTDSEVFLDTLSDVTFDADNQLKVADTKQVESTTNGNKSSNIQTPFHQDSLDSAASQAQNDDLVQTESHKEHQIETSKPQDYQYDVVVNKLSPDLPLKAEAVYEDHTATVCMETLSDIPHTSMNDISKNVNNDNLTSECYIANTVLNFTSDKKNESVSTCDHAHVDVLENTPENYPADIKTNQLSKTLEICHKLVMKEGNSVKKGEMINHGYSDSADSLLTSTDSSHPDNSLSSEHQQNKESQKQESYSENRNNIPTYQNGKVVLETDNEIKDIILTSQESKENRNGINSRQNGDISSYLMNKESSISECQDNKDIFSHVSSKCNSNQIQSENVESNSAIKNDLSGIDNSSVSDLASDGSGLHDNQSKISTTNSFNVSEILAHNKRQIDSSLETRFSGDESSTQSSSEVKHDDRKASTSSLLYNEASPSKDRLTFESLDSEYSDGGLLSPVSYQLSPVTESSGHLMDDTFPSRSGSEDSAKKIFENNQNTKMTTDAESRSASDRRSKDSSTSPSEWDPQKDGLHEMTLYAQGHSDTLLLLLVSRSVKCNKVYISSLWKSCLSHLAELDFQVKDAERQSKDDSENIGAHYQYIKYDSFTQNLKGSALLPVTSLANEIIDSSIGMHENFVNMPDLQEITYRSHSACCYGHRSINTETYFQLGLSRTSAGICPPNDKTFCLDQMAKENLAEG